MFSYSKLQRSVLLVFSRLSRPRGGVSSPKDGIPMSKNPRTTMSFGRSFASQPATKAVADRTDTLLDEIPMSFIRNAFRLGVGLVSALSFFQAYSELIPWKEMQAMKQNNR